MLQKLERIIKDKEVRIVRIMARNLKEARKIYMERFNTNFPLNKITFCLEEIHEEMQPYYYFIQLQDEPFSYADVSQRFLKCFIVFRTHINNIFNHKNIKLINMREETNMRELIINKEVLKFKNYLTVQVSSIEEIKNYRAMDIILRKLFGSKTIDGDKHKPNWFITQWFELSPVDTIKNDYLVLLRVVENNVMIENEKVTVMIADLDDMLTVRINDKQVARILPKENIFNDAFLKRLKTKMYSVYTFDNPSYFYNLQWLTSEANIVNKKLGLESEKLYVIDDSIIYEEKEVIEKSKEDIVAEKIAAAHTCIDKDNVIVSANEPSLISSPSLEEASANSENEEHLDSVGINLEVFNITFTQNGTPNILLELYKERIEKEFKEYSEEVEVSIQPYHGQNPQGNISQYPFMSNALCVMVNLRNTNISLPKLKELMNKYELKEIKFE